MYEIFELGEKCHINAKIKKNTNKKSKFVDYFVALLKVLVTPSLEVYR